MHPICRATHFLIVCSSICALGGCSGEERFLPVKGQVFVNGQPLKGATGAIAFVPDSTKGNATHHEPRAEINDAGEYEIKTVGRIGAPPGWYKVQVMAQRERLLGSKADMIPRWAVPIEYTKAERTPISIEVVARPESGAYDLKLKR